MNEIFIFLTMNAGKENNLWNSEGRLENFL